MLVTIPSGLKLAKYIPSPKGMLSFVNFHVVCGGRRVQMFQNYWA